MINQHFKLKKTIPWRWARSWDTFLGQEPGENCDPVEGGNGITDVCAHLPLGFGRKNPRDRGIFPLVMTNSLPWFFDGPNRNRWFTFLKKMGGSFHGELVNFQLVTFFLWPLISAAMFCWPEMGIHWTWIYLKGLWGFLGRTSIWMGKPTKLRFQWITGLMKSY